MSEQKNDRGLGPVRRARTAVHHIAIAATIGAAAALMLPVTAAQAASSVNVSWGTCVDAVNIQTNGDWAGGVRFNLGTHAARGLTLATRESWGWAKDARGQNVSWKWNNQYNVRFLDSAGRVLWVEYNSIPNGGQRTYSVGSNVATIEVSAGRGVNAYGYRLTPVVGAGVGYIS